MWERLKREEKEVTREPACVIGRLPEHVPTLAQPIECKRKSQQSVSTGAKRKVDEEIAETEREAVDGTPVWSSSGPSGPTSSYRSPPRC